MSIDSHTTTQTTHPSYSQPSRPRKAVMALVAALVSSTLLGGTLSLFEMRSNEAATTTVSVKPHPSTDGLAMRRHGGVHVATRQTTGP